MAALAGHREKHFARSAAVRDLILGMSDGLTTPFALAAGLVGASTSSLLVVIGGVAEITAGSISMGLGGYLAAQSQAETYRSELAREIYETEVMPAQERAEVKRIFRDYGLFGYPLAFYHRESFWRGEVPLWNPLNDCGIPFLAQWSTMVLYPGSLFYLLLPLSWSLGVFCLAHLFLAGLGMYFLAHRWTANRLAASVAGLAFAFNGFTLSSLMWPNCTASLGWMPFDFISSTSCSSIASQPMGFAAITSGM